MCVCAVDFLRIGFLNTQEVPLPNQQVIPEHLTTHGSFLDLHCVFPKRFEGIKMDPRLAIMASLTQLPKTTLKPETN